MYDNDETPDSQRKAAASSCLPPINIFSSSAEFGEAFSPTRRAVKDLKSAEAKSKKTRLASLPGSAVTCKTASSTSSGGSPSNGYAARFGRFGKIVLPRAQPNPMTLSTDELPQSVEPPDRSASTTSQVSVNMQLRHEIDELEVELMEAAAVLDQPRVKGKKGKSRSGSKLVWNVPAV